MIVVIDNYDSFTFNLVQILLKNHLAVQVYKNDEITIEELSTKAAQIKAFLLSPGPGHASEATLCHQIMDRFHRTHPVLGVCLGHQVIAHYFGAELGLSKKIHHGKVSVMTHNQKDIFAELPKPLKVVRYHSWTVKEAGLPAFLEVIARSSDGEIMGLKHSNLPLVGLQFHPESILTEQGETMVMNFFCRLC